MEPEEKKSGWGNLWAALLSLPANLRQRGTPQQKSRLEQWKDSPHKRQRAKARRKIQRESRRINRGK